MRIPNLCKNSVLLSSIMYTQLVVILAFLVFERGWSLEVLGYYSIYAHWVVLGSLFLLCLLRNRLNRNSPGVTLSLTFIICFLVFVLVEFVSQWMGTRLGIFEQSGSQWIHRSLAAVLVMFLVYRLVALLHVLDERNRAESQARMQALQSRIRPHFLFNSLNTIAELTATEPEDAEHAIHSLSLLFRAGLENVERSHSLESELNLCDRYLGLERWRLADKLQVKSTVSVASPQRWQVPKLLLQPLVENAVVHGVREDGSVGLEIDVKETNKHVSIRIKNSAGSREQVSLGNGMAVDNVRERLFVLFDDEQSFKIRRGEDFYQVIMRIPKQSLNLV